jgi:hypothetical protein
MEWCETKRLAILRAKIEEGLKDPIFVEGEAAFAELDAIINGYATNR